MFLGYNSLYEYCMSIYRKLAQWLLKYHIPHFKYLHSSNILIGIQECLRNGAWCLYVVHPASNLQCKPQTDVETSTIFYSLHGTLWKWIQHKYFLHLWLITKLFEMNNFKRQEIWGRQHCGWINTIVIGNSLQNGNYIMNISCILFFCITAHILFHMIKNI